MRWRIAPPAPEEMRRRFPDLHPVALQLLWHRGVREEEAVRRFLEPNYERDVHDPFLFRDMRRACARVWRALEIGQKIVIHGYYDADGVTGSVLLMDVFRKGAELMGADPGLLSHYTPHREKEGYGVRRETVEALAARGEQLMITVDCGIGCAAEIALAAEKGIDTIVVDHHQVPERIPECIIIHPWVEGETYPFKNLAAVGVAFKFACGFIRYAAERNVFYEPGYEKWLLDLVAIATVTDVVLLQGENRVLETFGLKVLNKTRRPGLKALLETAGLENGSIDTVSVGFAIGPRINAASRMEHASMAFDTLMAATPEEARVLAERLNETNRDRQRYAEKIMTEARCQVSDADGKKILVSAGEGWTAGIVGLVAGKFANELSMPVFVFGKDGDKFVGSGRSIPEFNVVAGMEHAKKFLAKFGGHPQACGLTIFGQENFDGFRRAIEAYAAEILSEVALEPALTVDAELKTSEITWDLVNTIAKFEPYGEGNPRPRFLLPDLELFTVALVGKTGGHVRLGVRGDLPKEIKLIAFNFAERAKAFAPLSRVDAVVEVGINVWNGRKDIQLKVVDMRQSEYASHPAH